MLCKVERQSRDLEVRGSNPDPDLNFSLDYIILVSPGTNYKLVFTYQFDLEV